MHFLTALIFVAGFAFVVCLVLVKLIGDLSQASVHESPAILETHRKPASAEEPPAKATESYESMPTELSDTAVSTIIPTLNAIAMGKRRPVQFMAASVVPLGCYGRIGFRTVSDSIERRIAEFAGVPYQNLLSRQQWEELWETEAKP